MLKVNMTLLFSSIFIYTQLPPRSVDGVFFEFVLEPLATSLWPIFFFGLNLQYLLSFFSF